MVQKTKPFSPGGLRAFGDAGFTSRDPDRSLIKTSIESGVAWARLSKVPIVPFVLGARPVFGSKDIGKPTWSSIVLKVPHAAVTSRVDFSQASKQKNTVSGI
jgi:hypothetical protein